MTENIKPTIPSNLVQQPTTDKQMLDAAIARAVDVMRCLQVPGFPGGVVVSGSIDLDRLKEVNDQGGIPDEYPELKTIAAWYNRKCQAHGMTSDAVRNENVKSSPNTCNMFAGKITNLIYDDRALSPAELLTMADKKHEASNLAKLYFMITGVEGVKRFKLVGCRNLKHYKELPKAYVDGYPSVCLFGDKKEFVRAVDADGVSRTFAVGHSVINEARFGWLVKTAKAAGERLTEINQKIKKFNDTIEGKIIEVEI